MCVYLQSALWETQGSGKGFILFLLAFFELYRPNMLMNIFFIQVKWVNCYKLKNSIIPRMAGGPHVLSRSLLVKQRFLFCIPNHVQAEFKFCESWRCLYHSFLNAHHKGIFESCQLVAFGTFYAGPRKAAGSQALLSRDCGH